MTAIDADEGVLTVEGLFHVVKSRAFQTVKERLALDGIFIRDQDFCVLIVFHDKITPYDMVLCTTIYYHKMEIIASVFQQKCCTNLSHCNCKILPILWMSVYFSQKNERNQRPRRNPQAYFSEKKSPAEAGQNALLFGFRRIAGIWLLVMLAGVVEEVGEIHVKHALLVFGKAYGAENGLVGAFAYVAGVMHAAQINEIEGGASHDEHGLKVTLLGDLVDVEDLAAVVGQAKLAHAHEGIVYRGRIGESLGAVGNSATGAGKLLLGLGLDGENLYKHVSFLSFLRCFL